MLMELYVKLLFRMLDANNKTERGEGYANELE